MRTLIFFVHLKKNKHKYLSALLSTLILILNSIIKHLNLTVNYSLSLSPFLYIFKYEQTNRTFSSLRSSSHPLILQKYPHIFQLCINMKKNNQQKSKSSIEMLFLFFWFYPIYPNISTTITCVPCIIWG